MAVKKKRKPTESWACFGCDVAMNCISIAGIGYSRTLDKYSGPVFSNMRFTKETHYYDRLKFAVKSVDQMWDLCARLSLPSISQGSIWMAVEEPFPFGMVGRKSKFQSAWIKQQTQMSGAFLAGMIRHGYTNVFEINNVQWRKVVADDLGITTHHTKWDKFKPKEWALENFKDVPDLPDLIAHSKRGLIPRPDGSRAKAVQPEDIYDALGICMWMAKEANLKWNSPTLPPSSSKSEKPKKRRSKSLKNPVVK
jgi:hypothetical protein